MCGDLPSQLPLHSPTPLTSSFLLSLPPSSILSWAGRRFFQPLRLKLARIVLNCWGSQENRGGGREGRQQRHFYTGAQAGGVTEGEGGSDFPSAVQAACLFI